ncbi:hypothetical protein LLH00_04850 [bacterium]|nr:hypothetical protein [bacterium]
MAVTEIPTGGAAYRVQPLDKDQASQQDMYNRREKKEKNRKQESERQLRAQEKGRIDLLV